MVNSSSRVNSSCTGRPVRSTAIVTRSSVSSSCLPPKPPPTRAANTRTRSGSSAKIRQISACTRYGTCELVRSTSRPSASSQPRVAWVSSAACDTRAVCHVPDTTTSAASTAASTSPSSPCFCATTLRCGSLMRLAAPSLSPWTRGAPGARAASGSNTAGSTS
jgi:hypothetical protein